MASEQLPEVVSKRGVVLRGSMAVVTRHGGKIHLWSGGYPARPSTTLCGLALIDLAPDAAPDNATCSRCRAALKAVEGEK